MNFKRFLVAAAISFCIPIIFFLGIWYGQGTFNIQLWSQYYKGLFFGIFLCGVPFGLLIALNVFYPNGMKLFNNKNEKRYSS